MESISDEEELELVGLNWGGGSTPGFPRSHVGEDAEPHTAYRCVHRCTNVRVASTRTDTC